MVQITSFFAQVLVAASRSPTSALLSPATGTLRAAQPVRPAPRECPVCSEPTVVGTAPAALDEISGMTHSNVHDDLFYAIVDSPPSGPQVFVLRESGDLVQTLNLTGVDLPPDRMFGDTQVGDWESLAVGPCTLAGGSAGTMSGSCVYVGDTGHNCERTGCQWQRGADEYRVLRLREPDSFDGGASVEVAADEFLFRFPDGFTPDVESMMMTPDGQLYVGTKENDGTTRLFRLHLDLDQTVTAEPVGNFTTTDRGTIWHRLFTGASVRQRDGVAIGFTLRTYTHVFYFPLEPGQSVEEALESSADPCELPSPHQPQAESISWERPNGVAYVVTSEITPEIYRVNCTFPGQAFPAEWQLYSGASPSHAVQVPFLLALLAFACTAVAGPRSLV